MQNLKTEDACQHSVAAQPYCLRDLIDKKS